MKNKILGLSALLMTSALAFAFKAEPLRFTGQPFQLTNLATPFDPLAYSSATIPANPATACPSNSKVCYIDVNTADVYTSLDAPSPSYVGKPKVDIQTGATGELADDIQSALTTSGESTTPVNGRIIYERN